MKISEKTDSDVTIVDEGYQNQLTIDSIRNPELTKEDFEEIEAEIAEASSHFQKSLEHKDIEKVGLFTPIFFSIFLILFFLQISRVPEIFKMNEKLSLLFESSSSSLEVKGLDDLDSYIREKVLFNLFSDSVYHAYLTLAGVKLTLKSAKLVKNPFKSYKFPEYISENYNYRSETAERTSRLGFWDYSNDWPSEGFSVFFSNLSLEDSLLKWREMKSYWIDSETFISLSVEIAAHCRNTYATVFYLKTITKKSSGRFEIEGYSYGISPELYSNSSEEFKGVVTIFSLLLFSFIFALVKFLSRYRVVCKRFISKLDLSLNLYDYLEVIVIICLTVCIVLFIKLNLVNIGKFELVFSEDEFDQLFEYSIEHRNLIRIASLTCLFSLIRLIAFLKIQLPSFGVLFETIRLSKNDMVNICFISAILYCGFVITGHIAYGAEEKSLNSLTSASLDFFGMMTGNVDFTYCTDSSCSVIAAIKILFIAIFYFVLTNLFYAVIISTFYTIKSKDRLIIAAKTEMLKDRTKGLVKILIGFISFNNRRLLYKEAKEYLRLSEITSSANLNENRDKMQNIENFIKGQMNISFIQKIKFNLSSLKTFLYSSTLVRQDVIVEKFKKKITEILTKEKIDEKVYYLKEFDAEHNFRLVRGLFCYFFLIVLFLVTTIPILRLRESFELSKVNQDYIQKITSEWDTEKKLAEVDTVDDIYDLSEKIFLGLLSEPYNMHNYIEFNNSIRMTIQFYDAKPNKSSFSKNVITEFITGSTNFSTFRGNNTKLLYVQRPSGDISTFKKKGGLITFLFDYNTTKNIFDVMRVDQLLLNGKFCAFEWVTTNANLNFLSYNLLLFNIGKDELIESSFKSVSISPFFHSEKEVSMTALNLLSMILCCYFFIANIIDLFELWKVMNARRLESTKKKFELDKVIDKICQPDQAELNSLTTNYTITVVKGHLKNLIDHISQLFKTFFSYFILVPFNTIEAASIILTFLTLISLFYINLHKFETNNISDVSFVADYIEYIRMIIAINSMTLLFQLPMYLQISSKISYLIRVMMKARLDFMFFTMMFYLILLGFVFSGYILLGHNLKGFSLISRSVFSIYFMQFGLFDNDNFKSGDKALGLAFIILYIIIIIFFLTTMFTAIISGSYETCIHTEQMTTIQKIIQTFRARYQGKKVITLSQVQVNSKDPLQSSIHRIVASRTDEGFFNEEQGQKPYFDNLRFFEALEDRLKSYDIKLRSTSSERDHKIKFSDPSHMPYLNEKMWESTSTSEKIEIWNGLSLQFRNESIYKLGGLFKVYGLQLKADYSQIQKKLWTQMSASEKLEMWKGCLSIQGRVDIWFIEDMVEEIFSSWETIGLREKIEIVKKYFSANGIKQVLWKALPRFSRTKLNLLLNLKEKLDYEVLMVLCISETMESPFLMEMIDLHLEELFDEMIFLDMHSMSNLLGEQCKLNYISALKDSALTECESLIDYKKFVGSQLSSLQHKLKSLSKNQRV